MPTKKTTTSQKAEIKKPSAKSAKKSPAKATKTSLLEVPAPKGGSVDFNAAKKWVATHKVPVFSVIIILALILLALPHLAVAWVDNKPITIFEYYKALDSKYGAQEKQQLVSEKLVEDEAQRRGVTVSDAEVNNQFQQIQQQASGSANLQQLLAQQGLTTDEFKEQLRLQALIKKMFATSATVSAQEVDDYINQNKDQFPQVDDATKQQVSQQLSQQKLVDAFQSWLQTAQQSNRVKGL